MMEVLDRYDQELHVASLILGGLSPIWIHRNPEIVPKEIYMKTYTPKVQHPRCGHAGLST